MHQPLPPNRIIVGFRSKGGELLMDGKRQELHRMLDELPDDALQRTERALKYCANPAEIRFTIAQAKERLREVSMSMLRMPRMSEEQSKRTGFISVGSENETGDFSSSMSAWDDGPVTYHLRRFRGYTFEMYERLELANDGTKLVLTQLIIGPNGTEQLLTADMPIPAASGGQ